MCYPALPAPRKIGNVVLSPLARFLTDAGDSGVLLPMTVVGASTLWVVHSHRLAWLLLRSVLAVCAVIVLLKLLFLSCGSHWQPGLNSPSGHACMSAVVYGTLATVLAGGRTLPARAAIALVASAFIGAIALLRIVLGIHTVIEVIIGLAVGTAGQIWFAWSYSKMAPLRVDLRVFGLALATTAVVAFGVRLPVESMLRHLAKRLGQSCEVALAEPPRAAQALPGIVFTVALAGARADAPPGHGAGLRALEPAH